MKKSFALLKMPKILPAALFTKKHISLLNLIGAGPVEVTVDVTVEVTVDAMHV